MKIEPRFIPLVMLCCVRTILFDKHRWTLSLGVYTCTTSPAPPLCPKFQIIAMQNEVKHIRYDDILYHVINAA